MHALDLTFYLKLINYFAKQSFLYFIVWIMHIFKILLKMLVKHICIQTLINNFYIIANHLKEFFVIHISLINSIFISFNFLQKFLLSIYLMNSKIFRIFLSSLQAFFFLVPLTKPIFIFFISRRCIRMIQNYI